MKFPNASWKKGLVTGLVAGLVLCIIFSLFVSLVSEDYPERVTFVESLIMTLTVYGLGCAVLGTFIGWIMGKRKK